MRHAKFPGLEFGAGVGSTSGGVGPCRSGFFIPKPPLTYSMDVAADNNP